MIQICLQPSDIRQELREFCASNGIFIAEFDVGYNQEPFLSINDDAMQLAIETVMDATKQPCLVFCSSGKNRTSCLVGCFRRLTGWSHTSSTFEYEQFTGPESTPLDIEYIENFAARR